MSAQWLLVAAIVWTAGLLGASVVLLLRGPTVTRRLMALDLLVLVFIVELALVAALTGRSYPLDAALALALLSFIATIAGSRYAATEEPFG